MQIIIKNENVSKIRRFLLNEYNHGLNVFALYRLIKRKGELLEGFSKKCIEFSEGEYISIELGENSTIRSYHILNL